MTLRLNKSSSLVLDVQDGHDQVDEPENKCNDRQYSSCGVVKLLHNYLSVNKVHQYQHDWNEKVF